MTDAVPVKTADRNYVIECAAIALLYVGVLWRGPSWLPMRRTAALATAATLLPILPMWLLLAAAWRYYRRIDEYRKQRFLEVVVALLRRSAPA